MLGWARTHGHARLARQPQNVPAAAGRPAPAPPCSHCVHISLRPALLPWTTKQATQRDAGTLRAWLPTHLQQLVRQHQRHHALDHGGGAGDHAGVVPPARQQLDVLPLARHRLLSARDGGGGLEGHTDDDALAVADAALHAARPAARKRGRRRRCMCRHVRSRMRARTHPSRMHACLARLAVHMRAGEQAGRQL